MTQEIQMNGFVYHVIWTHVGQYRRYGDFFRVAIINTNDTNPDSILKIMKLFYDYNVPLKENWNHNDIYEYFKGWCSIESVPGGFKYTKCEPYTD